MMRIFFSLVFLATAALLSAGIVRVVERPVAPWKASEPVAAVAKATNVVVVDEELGLIEDVDRGPDIELSQPIDMRSLPGVTRETNFEDLAEVTPRAQ